MAEPIQEGMLREIDEELRQDQFVKLWKRYGKYILCIFFLIISSITGYQIWRDHDITSREEQGEKFSETMTLTTDGKSEFALSNLSALQKQADPGYKMLANFKSAALIANSGDWQSAAKLYNKLGNDNSIDKIFRDLAILLEATQLINGGGDLGTLEPKIANLDTENNPWRHSARELIAVIAMKSKDKTKAQKIFSAIVEDAMTPQEMRRRAQEILSGFNE